MIFRQLFDATSSTYTYLIASRHGGEALRDHRSGGLFSPITVMQ
jgi:hypothetical protein